MLRVLPAALLVLTACSGRDGDLPPDPGPPPPRPVDADGFPRPPPEEWCTVDTDGDFIADREEGSGTTDSDADGIPDSMDLDSDGDGISDAEESGDTLLCTPARRCDSDALPDAQDLDSDDDGELDAAERAGGTDRCNPDTDGDGCSDYGERVLSGCTDPDSATLFGDCLGWSGQIVRTVPGEGSERYSAVTLVVRDVPGEPAYPYDISLTAVDAQPSDAVTGRTSSAFTGVLPGALLDFQLAGSVPEEIEARPDARHVFVQSVLLLGPGGTILDESRILIQITPACVLII